MKQKSKQPYPRVYRQIPMLQADPAEGLSPQETKLRQSNGLSNIMPPSNTKSEGQIIKENVLTFFNLIFLVLALCLGFSYFQSGAWLLDQPAKLCRSLFGWGYYLVAPALLLGSYILLFHRGRNVASCLVGTALLPVVFGAVSVVVPFEQVQVEPDGYVTAIVAAK